MTRVINWVFIIVLRFTDVRNRLTNTDYIRMFRCVKNADILLNRDVHRDKMYHDYVC